LPSISIGTLTLDLTWMPKPSTPSPPPPGRPLDQTTARRA